MHQDSNSRMLATKLGARMKTYASGAPGAHSFYHLLNLLFLALPCQKDTS